MICYLPYPYPDELLYSVIARYLTHMGPINSKIAIASIFGHVSKGHVDLPYSLSEVSNRTWSTWGLSGDQIIDLLTLFPFFAQYIPKDRIEKCRLSLLSDKGVGVHARLGVSSHRQVGMAIHLRFCKACRDNDISKYQETYWRRSHQLPGVLVCPEHGELLINTKALMTPIEAPYYVDATIVTEEPGQKEQDFVNEKEALIALLIARRCQKMLQGPINEWSADNVLLLYRRAAFEKGFVEGLISLSQEKLELAFVSYFGENFLARVGCEVQLGRNTLWFRNIFRRFAKTYEPIKHVLIQIFLENVPKEVSIPHQLGFGPMKCPNPYCSKRNTLPVTNIKIYKRSEANHPVATAKCSCCEYAFTFNQTKDTDPTFPIVSQVRRYGPLFKAEVQKLQINGLCLKEIGTKLGLHRQIIKRILNENPNPSKVNIDQIRMWREQWLKILDVTPNRSRELARKKDKSLYSSLRCYDKDWLYSEPRRANKPKKVRIADWEKRDIEWLPLLKDASDSIKSRVPIRQVTKCGIINKAGLPISILSKTQQLPKCHDLLNQLSESLVDLQKRKIIAAVQKVRELGKPPKTWRLRRLSGLEGSRLSPELTDFLRDISLSSS